MQCEFIKTNNSQCNAKAMKQQKLCYFHSQKAASAHKNSAAKGGKASSKNNLKLGNTTISGLTDVLGLLEETVNLLRNGEVHTNYVNAVSSVCNTYVKVYEKEELEKRILALEQLADLKANKIDAVRI